MVAYLWLIDRIIGRSRHGPSQSYVQFAPKSKPKRDSCWMVNTQSWHLTDYRKAEPCTIGTQHHQSSILLVLLSRTSTHQVVMAQLHIQLFTLPCPQHQERTSHVEHTSHRLWEQQAREQPTVAFSCLYHMRCDMLKQRGTDVSI